MKNKGIYYLTFFAVFVIAFILFSIIFLSILSAFPDRPRVQGLFGSIKEFNIPVLKSFVITGNQIQIQSANVITNLTVTNPTSSALTSAPVSFGVPFAEDLNIQNPSSELMLLDSNGNSVPVQWRTLSRWEHQTGAVKWALADFFVDVSANSSVIVQVSQGTSASSSTTVSVSDQGSYLAVNTGKMIAQISKSKFNLVDSVIIDADNDGAVDDTIVSSGTSQGLSYFEDGTNKMDTLNTPTNITVESSGPLHAVIRVDGWFKNSTNDNEYLYYVARLHFWAGKDTVQVILTTTDRHDTSVTPNWGDVYWRDQTVYNLTLHVKGNVGIFPQLWVGNDVLSGNSLEIEQENSFGYRIMKDNALINGTIETYSSWGPYNYSGIKGIYEIGSATQNASVSATPAIPVSGNYEVLVSWGAHPGGPAYRTANVEYVIQHSSGQTSVIVPRQDPISGSGWYSLGTFSFTQGSSGNIKVIAKSSGLTFFDAVRFVYKDGVGVDNITLYAASPFESNRHVGIGGVFGNNGGIFVSGKEFWQNYPKAIEVNSNGDLLYKLLPDGPHHFWGGMGKTSEFTLQFSPSNPNINAKKDELTAMQEFPLKAIAPSLYYYDTKALDLFGYTPKLQNPPEALARWDAIADAALPLLFDEQDERNMYSWRDYGDYWGNNNYGPAEAKVYDWANQQHNQPYGSLVQFLRTGNLQWWKYSESSIRHSQDLDFVKFRPFGDNDWVGTVHRKGDCGVVEGNIPINTHVCGEPIMDMSFEWRYSLPYYFLTGDSWSKDLSKMNIDAQRANYYGSFDFSAPIANSRVEFTTYLGRPASWIIWGLINGYEEFGEPVYLSYVDMQIGNFTASQDETGYMGNDPDKNHAYSTGLSASMQGPWAGWALNTLRIYTEYENDQSFKIVLLNATQHFKKYLLRKQNISEPYYSYQQWQKTEIVHYPLYIWTYEKNPSSQNFKARYDYGIVSSVNSDRVYLNLTHPYSTINTNDYYRGKSFVIANSSGFNFTYAITNFSQDAQEYYFESKCTGYDSPSDCVDTTGGKNFTGRGIISGTSIVIGQQFEFINTEPNYNFDIVNALMYYYMQTGDNEYKELAQDFFRYAQNRLCYQNGTMSWPATQSCNLGVGDTVYFGDALSVPFLFLNGDAGLVFIINYSDTTPPSTPVNLAATPISETQINLQWSASSDSESGVQGYKVYRNNILIAQPAFSSFSDTGLTPNTAYSYEVSAVNQINLESARSVPLSASTFADTNPPSLTYLFVSNTSLILRFSENIDAVSATSTGNYGIDNGINVLTASLLGDQKTVNLTTSSHTNGVLYTLNIINVRDIYGNVINPTSRVYQYKESSIPGLVAYWKFDETSGSTAFDSSGNNLHGKIIGATLVQGYSGNAYYFDGIDDFINVSYSPLLDTKNFTVSVWMRPNTTAAMGIFDKTIGGATNQQYLFFTESGFMKFRVFNEAGTGNDLLATSTPYILVGSWTHLVGTVNGTTAKFYLNGTQAASRALGGNLRTGVGNVQIGKLGMISYIFNGTIDEVMVFNRELSSQEISALYNGTNVWACVDADADGYGTECSLGADCDDSNPLIYFNANEICNDDLDNNCNTLVDNLDPVCVTPSCIDSDGDGYGQNCALGNDCNDGNANIHPGASEVCGNGIDENCDNADDACAVNGGTTGGGGGGSGKSKPVAKPATNETILIPQIEHVSIKEGSTSSVEVKNDEKILIEVYGNSYEVSFAITEQGVVLKAFNGDYLIPLNEVTSVVVGNREMFMAVENFGEDKANIVMGLDQGMINQQVEKNIEEKAQRDKIRLFYIIVSAITALIIILAIMILYLWRSPLHNPFHRVSELNRT